MVITALCDFSLLHHYSGHSGYNKRRDTETVKILVISGSVPTPPECPADSRLYCVSKILSQRHTLSLVCPSMSLEQEVVLENIYEKIAQYPSRGTPRSLGKFLHKVLLCSHFTNRLRYPEFYRQVKQCIERECERFNPDVVLLKGLGMAEFLSATPGKPSVFDLVDSLSLLYKRRELICSGIIDRLKTHLEYLAIRKLEAHVCGFADRIVVISDVDREYIQERNPRSDISVIPNCVDDRWFSDAACPGNRNLIFTGVMDYEPNADAAIYFVRKIFPLVLTKYPESQFHIVGKNPPEEVMKLGQMNNVHVTGEVPDLRPYIVDSQVYVSPLRFGAGMKNKILIAMAMNRPIVATGISVEGIAVKNREHVLVASSPEDMAMSICELLDDDRLRQSLIRNAKTLVETAYRWDSAAASFESLLSDAKSSG